MRHGSTRVVSFPTRNVGGDRQEQRGLVHIPSAPAPAGGYPVVVYGHMTTGGGPRAAPSGGSPTHPEWRRMSRGDALCDALLARGIAVLRPDYEGIGSPGIHPYLIGASLAASLTDMVRARHDFGADLGDDWVAAGHSEGAVAALWASVAPEPDDTSRLRGTAAFMPVTRLDLSIGAALQVPFAVRGFGVVPALIGLMIRGGAAVDPALGELVTGDGLSRRARELWPHLETHCLTELSAPSSWGALAPAAILADEGPGGSARGHALRTALFDVFRANDVIGLTGFRVPVRVDAARFDEVAPAPLTARLLRRYADAGVDVTARWWPSHHSGAMAPRYAPSEASEWIAARVVGER